MDKVLTAREYRSKLIKDKLKTNNVLIIKANSVGSNKRSYYAYFIIDLFLNKIKDNLIIKDLQFYDTEDGPFYLIEVIDEVKKLKLEMIKIEENHPLGRIVDLDVYGLNGNVSRSDFKMSRRMCLICNDYALVCNRKKTHSLEELNLKIDSLITLYLKRLLNRILNDAITLEASLNPKFGLVTKISSGSHIDMDFELLMKSKEVIIPDLIEMFFYGFNINDLDIAFSKARSLGRSTEGKMFEVTNNVNTYKGLIFILGVLLVALGYSIKNNQKNLFSNIKYIGRNLKDDFLNELNTFGYFAYKTYGFLGARGEVINGLENVKKAKELLVDFEDETLTKTLIYLIKNVEDTVLLKRSKSIENYQYFKNLVGSIEGYDLLLLEKITSQCIKNNISFGGSADLLVASIFIKLIEKELGVNYV